MAEDSNELPQAEVEIQKFNSIIDIPKYICSISRDSKEFIVYNVENNKICAKIPSLIPAELKSKGLICELNGSQLFYFSARYCLLIDIKTQSVELLKHRSPRFSICPIYYENFIYTFGGYWPKRSSRRCYKYNIRKNKWIKIAKLPSPSLQTSTIVYERKLLITGKQLKCIYSYNPEKNSYEEVFDISQEAWKNFFVLKNRCLVITSEAECYISGEKDWKHWHFYGNLNPFFWPVSNICYYDKHAWYFDKYSIICKFDLKNLKCKQVVSTS